MAAAALQETGQPIAGDEGDREKAREGGRWRGVEAERDSAAETHNRDHSECMNELTAATHTRYGSRQQSAQRAERERRSGIQLPL